MNRKRPRNRTVTECHKIKFKDENGGGAIYLHFDRPALDHNGVALGPLCAVRISYKHAKGSQLDQAFEKATALISREVQTQGKGA